MSYTGRVATTTNGNGQRQVETRNALDEVIRTADQAGTTVTHSYDTWGQVTETTTSGTGVSAQTGSVAQCTYMVRPHIASAMFALTRQALQSYIRPLDGRGESPAGPFRKTS